MDQAASPEGLGLPCTPKQALALYQHLFCYPAGLDQLQAVLWQGRGGGHCLPQGQEGWGCPPGLELPTALLEIERRRWAQEQLLWDLELLTGAGLGLLWPPRVQFCSLTGQAQYAQSQPSKPSGRTGGDSERPMSGAGDSLSQQHQLPQGVQAEYASAASGLEEARSDVDPSEESPGMYAGPTPGALTGGTGCLQELNLITSVTFGEASSSELKDLAQQERGQAEPHTQKPHRPPSQSLHRTELAQAMQRPSCLPAPQAPPERLTSSLGQERPGHQKLLRMETPQSQREGELQDPGEENPQGQKEGVSQGPRGEAPQGPKEGVSQGPRGEENPQGPKERVSQGPRGEENPQDQKEGVSQGPRGEAPQGPKEGVSQGPRGQAPQGPKEGVSQGPRGEENPQGPKEGVSQGPRGEENPQGPKEGVSQGPREEAPQGPKEGVSQGPRGQAPQGPKEGVSQGPRGQAPQGPKEGVSQGPREEAPQGPKEGVSQGPREEAPQGPKEGVSQGPRGETPQGPKERVSWGQREKAPWGAQNENKDGPLSPRKKACQGQSAEGPQGLREEISQSQQAEARREQRGNSPECRRKEVPPGQEMEIPPTSGGSVPQAWEVARGEAPTQPREDDPLGPARGFCRSPTEQCGKRERPGPRRETNGQRARSAPAVGKPAPHLPRPPPRPRLPGAATPEAPSTRGSGQQEPPVTLPGTTGLWHGPYGLQGPRGDPGAAEREAGEVGALPAGGPAGPPGAPEAQAPKPTKAAWPGTPGSEPAAAGVSAAQRQTALQRLLELHRAARCRRRQDRERQRLRVLELLCIARNRHTRVHPLGPPPSPAQHPSQEDAAGQRRALRERLQQVHRERTGRLRALGARNTQNFQELLWAPGSEKPAPGQASSPSPAPLRSSLGLPKGDRGVEG